MKGDGYPSPPVSGPLLPPRKDLFAGLLRLIYANLRAKFGGALPFSIAKLVPKSLVKLLTIVAIALAVVDARAAPAYPFTFDTLLADAKRRAAAPYSPQR